jgi:FKBP-type peptidyl-prolyl cis-trans isomerase FklB
MWTEALKRMPVGSKWVLYIPSDLAYGDEGFGDVIAPGETLIFDIELLGIK